MSEILHFNIFNDTEEHIEHYGVPGMKWGVRKENKTTDKQNHFINNYENDKNYERRLKSQFEYWHFFESSSAGVKGSMTKKDINQKFTESMIMFSQKRPKEKWLKQWDPVKRRESLIGVYNSYKKFNEIFKDDADNTNIYMDFDENTNDSYLYTKKSLNHFDNDISFIEHGGPGSGRYPKGFKMVKETSSGVKKSTEEASKAIPDRFAYMKSGHPNYDDLSDEYMNKVIKRKNLENDYARAVNEMQSKPSKGKVAKEVLQTVGAIAGIAVSVATVALAIDKINHPENYEQQGKKKNKQNN